MHAACSFVCTLHGRRRQRLFVRGKVSDVRDDATQQRPLMVHFPASVGQVV